MNRWAANWALSVAAVACVTPAHAGVAVSSYGAISGKHVVSFDELITGVDITNPVASNRAVDGIVYSQGVAIAEHFAGQTVSPSGDFDVLSDAPGRPLQLVAGAPGENLYAALYRVTDLATFSFDSVLSGVGFKGPSSIGGVGEGAMSFLFSSDQSQFGLQVIGMNGGFLNFAFFRQDGSLINSLAIRAADKSYLGFFSTSREIRGVSLWNSDPNGMSINNLKHDVASNLAAVPEPGQWALMLGGLATLSWSVASQRRIRRRATR
ncbi:PEP-CTERM sorting domain-containing protein [Aquabacterium sp. OR-4]|uniref:PEP-CTERM sorting domain-containing protein n=1 Tax=Aquabacterium sp. OR-4 TaxID=2978127 RepID=UPI0021B202D7|nr:PEP-CTERM sorting domain-containing protein [Aquabacterium sp. OR-4]MDT7838257.1 PEP-CTERM sorting domain-containing protein [Aquabacterium sp. OR-4]